MRKGAKRVSKFILRSLLVILVVFFLPLGGQVAMHFATEPQPWWDLRRDSSGQAPPMVEQQAVIQVYAARAARWRGAFGVHTWVSFKRAGENHYSRLEVIGYYTYYGRSAVSLKRGSPDAYWFGNRPTLLREITGGPEVDALIDRLNVAADNYPYANIYKVWPGPNSNTFIAWLARSVPELRLELPPHAIGKDYLPHAAWLSQTPSGLGGQVSIAGYAGVLVGLEEGLEFNVLGLTAGVDLMPPALKFPGVGRVGFDDIKRFNSPL